MTNLTVKFVALSHFDQSLGLPSYATSGAAGADLKISLPENQRKNGIYLQPWERVALPTGLSIEIPAGFEVQVRPRSGLSLKTGLMIPNSPGTIDEDYRGELKVIMVNLSPKTEVINHGDRIAQLVIAPVVRAEFKIESELSQTDRGIGGFGSTGRS